ncbi:integrase core domain-containing protein [Pseudomonas tohonis]|jgi:putative transposase|uniref:integrase core domain-containing protein n=3 Tax=Pseudomonas tohonis TaxID=2725477 RepID=UPI0005BCAE4B|nr:integrase core domain-containing protein [Pseudomonas tohonis]
MPWRELKPMDEKVLFIADYLRQVSSFSGLCEHFGISRKTGYKWVERYKQAGMQGLAEQSRKRHEQERTPYVIREYILDLRRRSEVELGPKKIQALVERRYPGQSPSRTTIYTILKLEGLIAPRRVRRRVPSYPKPLKTTHEPNELWSADYKGQFLTQDGKWCYPLTVMDHASRYLLACEGMAGTRLEETKAAFERLFRCHGLPLRLRTDNGTPFASTGRTGLTQLSIWWLRLGIIPERIAPGRPEQNGRHERMHRTLKRAVTQPVAAHMAEQQQRFDEFIQNYNQQRPHEALKQQTPSQCYKESPRTYPEQLPELTYPGHVEVYRADCNGILNRRGLRIYVGHLLKHEQIGLEQIGEELWAVHFGPVVIGRVDEQEQKEGYLSLKVSPM